MLLIVGTFRLPPENVAAARAIMARMIEASRAEEGCLDYTYAEDALEPGLFRVIELWTDQPALDRHFESPHMEEWRGAWPELGITERDLRTFDVGDLRAI
jgi:quinol monooxygenase YgiN